MTTMYPGLVRSSAAAPACSARCRRGRASRAGRSGRGGSGRSTRWPLRPAECCCAAAIAGVIGTALWRPTVLSVGYLVVGLMVFGVVYGTADRRPTRAEWIGIGLTLALLSVSAVLAAEWVGGLCLIAAWVVGWCTLAGGHTWTAVFTGPFLPWLLPGRVRGG